MNTEGPATSKLNTFFTGFIANMICSNQIEFPFRQEDLERSIMRFKTQIDETEVTTSITLRDLLDFIDETKEEPSITIIT